MRAQACRGTVLAALCLGAALAAPFEVNTLHGGAVGPGDGTGGGTYGSVETKQRPIAKVMKLLKDMGVQLESEQKEDEETYETFACWCKANDAEKTTAVATAEQRVSTLTAKIEELSQLSAKLTNDIASLDEAVAKGKHALAEATEVRDKELAEFNQRDKDAVVAINGLRGAVTTLQKHQAGAALSQEALLQVQHVLSHHIGQEQLRRLGLPVRRGEMSFLQQPQLLQSASSGEIFGVLQSMKENFEANQAQSRSEEEQAAAEFATLKQAKTDELAAANEQLDSKSDALAKASEGHANSKVDLKDTTAQLEADRAFLSDLKAKCAAADKEWEERSQMRQDEIKAVGEALEILSEGEARDLASKTTGFLQVSINNKRRAAAARLLQKGHPTVAMLSLVLKSDALEKTRNQILEHIKVINQNKLDEVKKKDECIAKLHDSKLDMDEKYHAKANLDARTAQLKSDIQTLSDTIATEKAEIAAAQIEMKKAGEVRAKESGEFTATIADQRAMQAILGKALAKLRAFYDRKAAFLQARALQDPEGPGFKPYRKEQGGMILATLDHIVKDSHRVQADAYSSNAQSQMGYEEFMKDMNKLVITVRKQISDQTEQIAANNADLERMKADIDQNMDDLDALNAIDKEIHSDCDFLVDNFTKRQKAMVTEVDSLYEAIAIMGGDEAPPPAKAEEAVAAAEA